MKSVEFKTNIHNGFIEIPPDCSEFVNSEVNVILIKAKLDNSEINTQLKKFDELQKLTNNTIKKTAIDIDRLEDEIN